MYITLIEFGVPMKLVGKPEGKRPIGRPSCMWMDNIQMGI
jgi:hypothetical protein